MAKEKKQWELDYDKWSGYEEAGARNLRTIGPETSLEDLCTAIEVNIGSLNHEDECAIPAYKEAVRRLRLHYTRYMEGNP